MDSSIYNEEFHKDRDIITRHSAKKVLGLLDNIYTPKSCVDVGGGIGVWIDEFTKIRNNCNAKCLDGDYINENMLVISKDRFVGCDLTKKIDVLEKYDLAISLEVAEHLPEQRAETFVEDLTKLSDVVLFSAAIKGQGGEGHINEQYMSYWVKLFCSNNFVPVDVIRPFLQDDLNIPWWYRQNMMIYINNSNTELVDKFKKISTPPLIHFVIEDHYEEVLRVAENNIWTSIRRKMGTLFSK